MEIDIATAVSFLGVLGYFQKLSGSAGVAFSTQSYFHKTNSHPFEVYHDNFVLQRWIF